MIWGGSPSRIIEAAEKKKIRIILSEEMVHEINETLAYPRLRRVYESVGVKREELIEAVLRTSQLIETTTKINFICEDPEDNKFIECAVAGEAEYIVSGDKHLLKAGKYKKTKILSTNEFNKTLEKKKIACLKQKNNIPRG